jgi:hypothetical protein
MEPVEFSISGKPEAWREIVPLHGLPFHEDHYYFDGKIYANEQKFYYTSNYCFHPFALFKVKDDLLLLTQDYFDHDVYRWNGLKDGRFVEIEEDKLPDSVFSVKLNDESDDQFYKRYFLRILSYLKDKGRFVKFCRIYATEYPGLFEYSDELYSQIIEECSPTDIAELYPLFLNLLNRLNLASRLSHVHLSYLIIYIEPVKGKADIAKWVEEAKGDDGVYSRRLEIQRDVLRSGATYDWGLHEAVEDGDMEKVKEFIQKGADVNREDTNHENVVQIALEKNRKEIFLYLISQGADVNRPFEDGGRIVHDVLGQIPPEMFGLLLEYVDDVNVRGEDGDTPLHNCIFGLSENESWILEKVKLLINKGADINAVNNKGQTPLDLDFSSDKEVSKYLREHGAKTGAELKAEKNSGDK